LKGEKNGSEVKKFGSKTFFNNRIQTTAMFLQMPKKIGYKKIYDESCFSRRI
jgi:hypothetical protein